MGALERCRHCQVTLGETSGSVSGPNIGARGYRWFDGQGLVRRAKIQTDVFGADAGKIGGAIQFAPIQIKGLGSTAEAISRFNSRLRQPS